MKAAKIYAVAVSLAMVGLFAHAWTVHPEIQANRSHAENCQLWHGTSQKNYQVTMERLKLRLGEDTK